MPLPQHMHPEFGYLSQSTEARRTLRVAMAAAVFGSVLGAGATLALTTPHYAAERQQALAITTGDREALASPVTAAVEPAPRKIATPHRWWSGQSASIASAPTTEAAPPSARAARTKPAEVQPATASVTPTSGPNFLAAVPFSLSPSELGTPATGDVSSATPKRHERTAQAHRRKRHHDDDGYSSYATPYRLLPNNPREALERGMGWGW